MNSPPLAPTALVALGMILRPVSELVRSSISTTGRNCLTSTVRLTTALSYGALVDRFVNVELPPPVLDMNVQIILDRLRPLSPPRVVNALLWTFGTVKSRVMNSIMAIGTMRKHSEVTPTLCGLTPPLRHLGAWLITRFVTNMVMMVTMRTLHRFVLMLFGEILFSTTPNTHTTLLSVAQELRTEPIVLADASADAALNSVD